MKKHRSYKGLKIHQLVCIPLRMHMPTPYLFSFLMMLLSSLYPNSFLYCQHSWQSSPIGALALYISLLIFSLQYVFYIKYLFYFGFIYLLIKLKNSNKFTLFLAYSHLQLRVFFKSSAIPKGGVPPYLLVYFGFVRLALCAHCTVQYP